MHYQHLKNFIDNRIRKNDIFVPAMILFLVKNDGWGTKEQIARLIYIFDYKQELPYYDTIVEKFAGILLQEYDVISKEEDIYRLKSWPLTKDEIHEIALACSRKADGFFATSSATKALIKEEH